MKTNIPAKIKDCVPQNENYSFSDFEKLYDKYAGALYNIILTKVADKDAANKILENTFCFAFKNINEYNSSKSLLFTWIKNILQFQINIFYQKNSTNNNL